MLKTTALCIVGVDTCFVKIQLNGAEETACSAFFDVAAATASLVHPINAAVSVLYLRSFFNAAYTGLGTRPDGPHVKPSEKSLARLHCRPGGNAGGGGATEDLVEDHPGGPRAS